MTNVEIINYNDNKKLNLSNQNSKKTCLVKIGKAIHFYLMYTVYSEVYIHFIYV